MVEARLSRVPCGTGSKTRRLASRRTRKGSPPKCSPSVATAGALGRRRTCGALSRKWSAIMIGRMQAHVLRPPKREFIPQRRFLTLRDFFVSEREEQNMKRALGLMLALLLVGTMAAGCAGGGTEDTDNTLTVAMECSYAPYNWTQPDDANGAVPIKDSPDYAYGYDVMMAKYLADKLGMELVIEDMEFNSIISAVQSGNVDFGMAGMTVTEDRLKNVDFSESYATGVQVVIVKADSDYQKPEDLTGKKVGVQEGTTGDIIASGEKFGEKNKVIVKTDVKRYKKGVDAVMDLKNGAIDAVVIDEKPAQEFVKNNAKKLKLVVDSAGAEYYCIAITKGNTAYKEEINKQIKAIKKDGTYDKLKAKYIDSAN